MSAKKQPAPRGWRNPKVRLLAAAMVASAAVSGGVAWSLTDSRSHPAAPKPAPGDQYATGVYQAFSRLRITLPTYLTALQKWRTDKADDSHMETAAKSLLGGVAMAQHTLTGAPPFPQAPRVLTDYRATADLYGRQALLVEAATAVPQGDLRTQLQLAAARLQTLADQAAEQAAAEMKPQVSPDQQQSLNVTRASWATSSPPVGNIAAGPPLTDVNASPTPAPQRTPPPAEPLDDWLKLARGADIPTEQETEKAIDGGAVPELSSASVRFTQAAALLQAGPDPRGASNLRAGIQLALLVDAEATQIAQAATMAPTDQHETFLHIAQALALIGDDLWDPRLGKRDSTYPQSLLAVQQPAASPKPTETPPTPTPEATAEPSSTATP